MVPKILIENDVAPQKYVVLDEGNLWMLVRREEKLGKPAGVMYCVATSSKEIWDFVIRTEFFGTGWTKKTLMEDGWSAERVTIVVPVQ